MRWIMAALSVMMLAGIAAAWPRGGRAAPAPYPGAGQGVLVPYSHNPGAPTVVVVHGINLFPRFNRNTLAQDAAQAAAQHGANVNVMGWDWNDVTRPGLRPRVLIANARQQGERLASALQQSGVDASQVQIVGHSLGTVVAAQAARTLTNQGAQPAGLTLLDVPGRWHGAVYGRIQAGSAAGHVENVWAPGLTGLGKPANVAGVSNHRSPASPGLGTSNHAHCASSYCNNLPNGNGRGGAPAGPNWAPHSVPAGREAAPANSAYAFNARPPQMAAPATIPNAGYAYRAPGQPVGIAPYGSAAPPITSYPIGQPALGGYAYGTPTIPVYPAGNVAPSLAGPTPAAGGSAIPASLNSPATFVPASMSRPR